MSSEQLRLDGLRWWNVRWQRGLVASLLVSLTTLTSGCFFPSSFSAFFLDDTVFLSTTASLGVCTPEEEEGSSDTFSCAYADDVDQTDSFFSLSSLGLEFFLFFLDPLVVQLPAGASNVSGSFLHTDSGVNGALAITAGLFSVGVDATRTLMAEPGTQLVTIALPDGVPTTGDFAFNFNFQLPPGTTSLEMKPLLTGLVRVNGQPFYPPVLPCLTDMAAVPAITTPLPVPGDTLSFPSISGLGCQGETYDYSLPAIPTLPQWALLLLTLSLLTLATWQLIGQPTRVGREGTGAVILVPTSTQWPSSLLWGQGLATVGLLGYALFHPLVPHDGMATLLAGLLLGVMIEGYRRSQ